MVAKHSDAIVLRAIHFEHNKSDVDAVEQSAAALLNEAVGLTRDANRINLGFFLIKYCLKFFKDPNQARKNLNNIVTELTG